jgi:hypothetical protein
MGSEKILKRVLTPRLTGKMRSIFVRVEPTVRLVIHAKTVECSIFLSWCSYVPEGGCAPLAAALTAIEDFFFAGFGGLGGTRFFRSTTFASCK